MSVNEAGALGAAKTNKLLTTEGRRQAALKGWRNHFKKKEALSKPKK